MEKSGELAEIKYGPTRPFPAVFMTPGVPSLPDWQRMASRSPQCFALMGHMHRTMLERYSHIRIAAERDAMAGIRLREQGEPIPQNSEAVAVAATPATI